MSTESESAVTHEPRKLGLVGKAIVALMVLGAAGLVVGAAVAVRAKMAEEEKREETLNSLKECARAFSASESSHHPPPRVTDPLLEGYYVTMDAHGVRGLEPAYKNILDGGHTYELVPPAICDAWGHPIELRCPGHVHKNGWDLISCGPNGIYEEGGGDDIVVGEDLPGGIAAIESSR